jgi:hypothetical protein
MRRKRANMLPWNSPIQRMAYTKEKKGVRWMFRKDVWKSPSIVILCVKGALGGEEEDDEEDEEDEDEESIG